MAQLFYKDGNALVILGEITTNQSLSVDEALALLDIDPDEYFIGVLGWDDWDYNALEINYSTQSADVILTDAVKAEYNKVARVELDTDSQWAALDAEIRTQTGASGQPYFEVRGFETKSGRPETIYLED